jgi:PAP2 superfamily
MTTLEIHQPSKQASVVRSSRQSIRRACSWVVEPATQLILVLGAALIYFGVRGLTEADRDGAIEHARRVVGFERHVGLDVEARLQHGALDHHAIVTAVNWIYIWGHWPVIIATLVWLHHTRRDVYRLLRNAMFISGAIGLVVFAKFPVAPPRLAGLGFVDTVTEHSNSYRLLQPPALVNKYAAVPSLHVGWNFLVGVMLWRHAARRWTRRIATASPVLMFTAVVLTGNHYVIDGILGIAVATTGLALATRLPHGSRSAGATRMLGRRTLRDRSGIHATERLPT